MRKIARFFKKIFNNGNPDENIRVSFSLTKKGALNYYSFKCPYCGHRIRRYPANPEKFRIALVRCKCLHRFVITRKGDEIKVISEDLEGDPSRSPRTRRLKRKFSSEAA